MQNFTLRQILYIHPYIKTSNFIAYINENISNSPWKVDK